jgi:hypothetical protein
MIDEPVIPGREAPRSEPGIHDHRSRRMRTAARSVFMDSGLAAARRPGMTAIGDARQFT